MKSAESRKNPLGGRMLAVALVSAAGTLFGDDAITLKKSDLDTWKDGSVTQSSMSSFLKNHDGYTKSGTDLSQYGWSDGNDPDPSKDYVVNGNKTLFTPYVAATVSAADLEGICHTFPGHSLTLDNGILGNRSCNDKGPAEVCVPNLIIKKGTLSNVSWGRSNRWSGQITIDTSSYGYVAESVKFSINLQTSHLMAKLVASNREAVRLSGTGIDSLTSANRYYWEQNAQSYRYRFAGDCTAYFATNICSWGAQAQLDTGTFNGSFQIDNVGSVKVLADSVIDGAIVSRDGLLLVDAGRSLQVCGGIDAAYADFSTHVSKGTNVYTRLEATVPYANTNYVNGGWEGRSIAVNVIDVAAAGSLATPTAALDGTYVQLATGAKVTVGDATFRDVTLSLGAGATLALTNSFVAETPILLNLTTTADKSALVTLPVGKGELRASDFRIAGGVQFQYLLSVETTDGLQTLYVTDLNPSAKNETTGYVVMTNADANAQASSFRTAGNWKNGLAPQAGMKYYTNGKTLSIGASGKFQGDSLTQSGMARFYGGYTVTNDDWRVIGNNQTVISSRTQFSTAGGTWRDVICGMLTVFSDARSPFTLYGGLTEYKADGSIKAQQTWELRAKVRGGPEAVIAAEGAITRAPGAHPDVNNKDGRVAVELLGDMSEYYGTLLVGTNETVRLGNWGLTNGTLITRTAYSTITTKADAGAVVPVRRYVAQTSTTFDVPTESTLAIMDGADLTGTLTKNGAGTLAIGGVATAGANARLAVAAGALMTRSRTALAGIPVDFAAGAGAVVDWADEDGLFLGASDVTLGGESFVVRLEGAPLAVPRPMVKKLLTVKDRDAAGFTGKLAVTHVNGLKVRLLEPVSDDGLTTYSALILAPGFVLNIR